MPRDSSSRTETAAKTVSNSERFFTNDEVRNAIAGTNGNFQVSDIEKSIQSNFPSKTLYAGQVPAVIFALKKKGAIKMIAERQGKKGAIYCKV